MNNIIPVGGLHVIWPINYISWCWNVI